MSDTTILPGDEPSTVAPVMETRGDAIGPYHLLQVIGEGGFGVVWLAERRGAFTQRVALKVLKPGMDSRSVVARFEQERQALAVMDHPNVAKVLDGGLTPLGRPYFVMEHVQGEAITKYCDRHRLTIRERLELFIPVCEAVQHAHMKGIIHRDIKPSNILVTIADSRGVPKVIDFGVAKAVSTGQTQRTVFTEHGQLIGTPEYMSPEQAEMGALDVDTRTDVYSLGVVLYELISGVLPFDPKSLRNAGYDAIRKIIREQDAPKPSTRLSTIEDSAATEIARTRQSKREELAGQLRRELDWIPLKALRKQRTERYSTPADLARDVRRYLDNESLEAGPESAAYRLKKFVRRRRGPVAAGAAVALALVAGAVASTIGFVSASRNAEEAKRGFTAAKASEATARTAEAAARKSESAAVRASREAGFNAYIANINLARSAIDAKDFPLAREALGKCPEELRAWEWHLLDGAMEYSLGGFAAHGGPVRSIQYSPDGARLATASADGTARVWDSVSGDLLAELDTGRSPVNGVAWSPDGERIASATADGRVRLWSKQGAALGSTPTGEDQPTFIAWSPVGGHIAAMYMSGKARIMEDQGLVVIQTIEAHEGLPAQLAFNEDGKRLYTSGWNDHKVVCWEVTTGAKVWEVDSGTNITSIAHASKAPRLAGTNFWWPFTVGTDSPRQVDFLKEPGRAADALEVVLSADGSTLLIGGRTSITAYNLNDRKLINQRPMEFSAMQHVALHPNGKIIARTGDKGWVKFWELERPFSFPARTLPAPMMTFNDRVFVAGRNGGLVAFAQVNGAVEIVDLDRDVPRVKIAPKFGKIVGAAMNRDASRLVTCSADGKVLAYAAPFKDAERVVELGHSGGPMAMSPDGKQVFVGCADGSISVVEGAKARSLTPDGTSVHDGAVYAVAISADGSKLATAGFDLSVQVWDIANGRRLASAVPHSKPVLGLAFSPDGSQVAAASMDMTATILNAETLAVERTLRGHTREVTSISFAPGGSRIATTSWDGTVRLWSTEWAQEVYRLSATGAHVAAFAPDGTRLTGLCTNGIFEWTTKSPAERFAAAKLPDFRSQLDGNTGMRRVHDEFARGNSPDDKSPWSFRVAQSMQLALSFEAAAAAHPVVSREYADEEEVDTALAKLGSNAELKPEVRSRAVRIARDMMMAPVARQNRLRGVLLREGDALPERALRDAEALYAANPLTENLLMRGVARCRAGRFAEAAADLSRAIEQRRSSTWSIIEAQLAERGREKPVELAYLAMALHGSGKKEEASQHMSRLRALMPMIPAGDEASQVAFKRAQAAVGN